MRAANLSIQLIILLKEHMFAPEVELIFGGTQNVEAGPLNKMAGWLRED